MTLGKLVLDKIESLGIKGAAEYFERSESAIRTWKASGNIPLNAVEKVMADAPATSPAQPPVPALPMQVPVTPAPAIPTEPEYLPEADELAHPPDELDKVWARLKELNERATKLETHLGFHAFQNASVVPPQPLPTATPQPVAATAAIAPPVDPVLHWSRPHRAPIYGGRL